MRVRVIWLAALCGGAAAFEAGPALRQVPRRRHAAPALAVEGLHDALQQGMHGASLLLADRPQTAEAIRAAEGTLGWWGTYIKTVEDGLITLHDLLSANGVPNAYGLSIFLFVLGVKLVTLPLNWKQIDSSAQMKAIKPQQDLLNKWYADNTQLKNNEIGTLFEKVDVNPLAGCLPSLAQIPVFLGVYYSVTAIAKAKIFDEGFLWIPNLSGPISDRTEGLTWLTQGWVDGHPRLGWHDTLCYVSIPLILVCAQTLSLYLLGSFDALDESENSKTAAVALRFLPLMIGWFSLNAPSGLGLYWTFNNILTTATTVTVKKLVEKPLLEVETAALLAQVGPRKPVRPPPDDAAAEWVPAGAPSAAVAAAAESSSSAVTAPAAESA